MSVELHPTPEVLPEGVCNLITSEQDRLNIFSQHQTIYVPETYTGVVVSTTAPTDVTKVWLKLDDLSRPTRMYYYGSGAWLSLHALEPGSIIIWLGNIVNLPTFDGGGGVAEALTDISGPMWEEVSELQAKFPIGAGTTAAPFSTAIAVGDTGGEQRHALLLTETPSHDHDFTVNAYAASSNGVGAIVGGVSSGPAVDGSFTGTTEVTGGDSATPPVTTPHENMPPYYGVYFIRRTVRKYYRET